MRVSPWHQYHLVEQEANPVLQVPSRKDQVSHGSTSFAFYRDASVGPTRTPLRLGPIIHSETSSNSSTSNGSGESFPDNVVDESEKRTGPRSSMKKPFTGYSSFSAQAVGADLSLRELPIGTPGFTKRRRVKWTDEHGKSLVEIKEFEISDDEELSDDEPRRYRDKCRCVIQ